MRDILLNEDGSLKVVDGDLVIGESTVQHQNIILSIGKGSIRHFPALGVNASSFLLDESPDSLLISIRKEFKKDGMTVKKVELNDVKIQIDASYENI